MEYSDWVESNGRVWLNDDMTALGQFAYSTLSSEPSIGIMAQERSVIKMILKVVLAVKKVFQLSWTTLMVCLRLVKTRLSGIYQRISLLITLFNEASPSFLKKMLTLVRFYSKFTGAK